MHVILWRKGYISCFPDASLGSSSETIFTAIFFCVHAKMFLETDFLKMIEWVALVSKSLSCWQCSLIFIENHLKMVNVSYSPWQILFSIHFITVWKSHYRPETWNLHELRNPSHWTKCPLSLLSELQYCCCEAQNDLSQYCIIIEQ